VQSADAWDTKMAPKSALYWAPKMVELTVVKKVASRDLNWAERKERRTAAYLAPQTVAMSVPSSAELMDGTMDEMTVERSV
jgi:hypothetical protein